LWSGSSAWKLGAFLARDVKADATKVRHPRINVAVEGSRPFVVTGQLGDANDVPDIAVSNRPGTPPSEPPAALAN